MWLVDSGVQWKPDPPRRSLRACQTQHRRWGGRGGGCEVPQVEGWGGPAHPPAPRMSPNGGKIHCHAPFTVAVGLAAAGSGEPRFTSVTPAPARPSRRGCRGENDARALSGHPPHEGQRAGGVCVFLKRFFPGGPRCRTAPPLPRPLCPRSSLGASGGSSRPGRLGRGGRGWATPALLPPFRLCRPPLPSPCRPQHPRKPRWGSTVFPGATAGAQVRPLRGRGWGQSVNHMGGSPPGSGQAGVPSRHPRSPCQTPTPRRATPRAPSTRRNPTPPPRAPTRGRCSHAPPHSPPRPHLLGAPLPPTCPPFAPPPLCHVQSVWWLTPTRRPPPHCALPKNGRFNQLFLSHLNSNTAQPKVKV